VLERIARGELRPQPFTGSNAPA